MPIEFFSETKVSAGFLNEVISLLKWDKEINRPTEEREIVDKIIEDLELESDKKPSNPLNFTLLPNEYNFLSQNEKSLWAEYLIFRYKFRIYPKLKRLTSFPVHLLVEPTSYCNLKCSMCFQSDTTFTKRPYMGYMDVGLFKHIVDEAVQEGNRAFTIAARGEPTLHPGFGEILEYAKGKFFDYKINTNAMLLDKEKCHQILQSGISELVFSVDSAKKEEYERIRRNGKFEQVVGNIKRFSEIRKKEYPKSKCRTRVSGVKYTEDFDTENFVKFWERFVNNVVCVSMQSFWDTYNNKPSDRHSPCPLLWGRMYIWFDGTANPCDCDYKSFLNIGNVREESIKEIWTGREFARLREDHIKGARQYHIPCDRCGF